jgi:sarcosine oxidase
MTRWPQWRLGDDVTALYQEQSGIAMASHANATHRRMAVEHGATLVAGSPVTRITSDDDGVTVEIGEEKHRSESLIVAAGAWTNSCLGHLGVTFPLEVTLEQVVYLRPSVPDEFAPDRFPIWIWMTEPSFYGFPVFGEPAVKVAWDRCEVVTDADNRSHDPLPEATAAIREFTAAHLPGADSGVHLARTCLYTLTPDRDFVIDRVPGTTNVYTAVGAGHAFKFASLIGRMLTDLALDGETPHGLGPFLADRAVLRDPEPVRTYMV